MDSPEVRHNRPVDRVAAVLVLAVGVLFAASLIASIGTGNGSPLGLVVGIALLVLVVQTMRRAWPHLHR